MNERKRIVIIDDTDANRYVLRKILKSQPNYDVLEAGTGAAGLELIDECTNLVIIDINLPDMNGFDLIQAIEQKLDRKKLPSIINISATFVSGKDKAMGLNQGAQAYLTHPINRDEVLATIASLLKSSYRLESIENQRNVAIARSEDLEAEKIMLERFMRSLNHDLRSPLTTATMIVNLMKRTPERRTDDMLKLLEENLQRMNRMITNVLDISHTSMGGGIKLNAEHLDLKVLLQEAVESLRIQVRNEIVTHFESPDQGVYWDKHAFLRILDNLVINAAKHGLSDTQIEIIQRHENDRVVVAVRNQGQMPDEVLTNLATPYFISSRSNDRGWGLGLPIVKALCEGFGGHATFSNEAEHVRVEVHLPYNIVSS
ncbi:K+-sensing histidine kinase KdpD [Pseudomonas duriflava]|uniref:histidine kinase n=1 Tax=Pseudomonas duriflava TaxID=459528 RepID=A0A562QPI1_9PSED|nr:response regulator [Pseudomonas duriflava]TWI58659.1 K+-sensing histidine kinase KdpD [Pseudomonas duriflava]